MYLINNLIFVSWFPKPNIFTIWTFREKFAKNWSNRKEGNNKQ